MSKVRWRSNSGRMLTHRFINTHDQQGNAAIGLRNREGGLDSVTVLTMAFENCDNVISRWIDPGPMPGNSII